MSRICGHFFREDLLGGRVVFFDFIDNCDGFQKKIGHS